MTTDLETLGIQTGVGTNTGGGTPRPTARSASAAMAWRALLKLRHQPEQMVDAIAIPVLFTLLFTYLFGGALSGSTHAYLQELLPGSLVMTVLLLTVYAGLGINADKLSGRLDRFRTMPLWHPSVVVGGLVADLARYLVAGVLVVGLGLAMGYRPEGGAVGVLTAAAVLFTFAFCLSWVWVLLGLLVRSTQSLSVLSFVVQFPLVFASNVFVDPTTLPGWLHGFVDANPVSLLVTCERSLMDGTATWSQVGGVLSVSVIILACLAPLTMHLYRRQA